ncbi:MAG: ATP-binding protein [Gammaproteobacteria bacterium]|nr:ATP-binding protein [Gammaproteobacteria bacterium]MDH5802359.1 ATP-binding protein [Gammaproteobacteria bacterium]
MNSISFKYRIAIVFFILVAIIMAFTLWLTLSRSLDENRKHLIINENVIVKQIIDLSRIALFTLEFDDLQPYIEQYVEDPHVVKILVADRKGRVLVSSAVEDLGSTIPTMVDDNDRFWRVEEISNTSGVLGILAVNFSHAELIEVNRQVMELGVKIAVISMIVTAVVGMLLGILLTRRLSALAQAASKFASGNLDMRVKLKGSDEVAVVGTAFDNMADSIAKYVYELRQSQSRLREAHDDLENRVRDRTQELAVARDEALKASQTKSKFLASMSHELRTPLNAILGYSELLKEEAEHNKDETLVSDLGRINSAGTHLLSLINNILDLSKIEAGKMDFFPTWVEVKPFVDETILTMEPLLAKHNNKFSVHYDGDLGQMYVDKTKIRQVLINLLSNATRFAEGKAIRLEVSRMRGGKDEWMVFEVADEGVGMDSNKLNEIFNEFSQLDSARKDNKGTGLGLPISQKICCLMGGEITVKSELHCGSTFRVRIPSRMAANAS